MSRVVIAGSRVIPALDCYCEADWKLPINRLKALRIIEKAVVDSCFDVEEVISGHCWGIDQLGEEWAESYAIPVLRFPADWSGLGKAAGMIRNRTMAKQADAAIVIISRVSRGSVNMISEMRKLNKPVFVVEL